MNAAGSARPEPFSVALLGPCRFTLGSRDFAFLRRRSALPLLVFLALNRHAPVGRDHAAFSLWPDETEERARELLRRNLFLLARSLPGSRLSPWFFAENDTLGWNADAPWELDVARFEDDVRSDDPKRLAAAVASYRADLCEGLYDEWVLAERERLRSLYLAALDRLVHVYRGRGEYSRALGFALRARAAEPWREDVARRVMRLRFALGDRSGAIAEFERFAARLRDELGAEPMAETLSLRDAIVRGGALAEHSGDDVDVARHAGARAPKAPLVGREHELRRLRAAWCRTARGSGSVVLVTGERGIGKTRLLAELALAVEAEGGCVLAGATSLPERRPYEAIGAALSGAWRLFAELPVGAPELAALATIAPELQSRCALRWEGSNEPIREQARLFDALANGIVALARRRPTLLVLDDLHAAGETTLAALAHIASRAVGEPLLIVGAFRTERAPKSGRRWPRELSGSASVATLSPSKLSVDDLASAFEERVGDAAVVREIAHACGGNPGALAALVHEVDAPLGVRFASRVHVRFDGCSDDARAFGEMAALAGQEVEVEIVARALGWVERRAWDALDELLDLRVVEDASRGSIAYRFSDGALRAAIERSVARDVRRRRHRRLAAVYEALDREGDDRSRQIARHAERSGDLERAARAYELAAQRAFAAFALEDARAFSQRGLLCLRSEPVELGALVSAAPL